MPRVGVYFETPARTAFSAAASTCSGGSKSGSPTLNEMTSTPWARSSDARVAIATVAEGLTRSRRFESGGVVMARF